MGMLRGSLGEGEGMSRRMWFTAALVVTMGISLAPRPALASPATGALNLTAWWNAAWSDLFARVTAPWGFAAEEKSRWILDPDGTPATAESCLAGGCAGAGPGADPDDLKTRWGLDPDGTPAPGEGWISDPDGNPVPGEGVISDPDGTP